MLSPNKATVFNVLRSVTQDGPGTRTELFLKGCTLRCSWCGYPETFTTQRQIGVYKSLCLGVDRCGNCLKVCPKGGKMVFQLDGYSVSGIDENICDNCLICADHCPSNALKVLGSEMTVLEAMEIILKDKEIYKKTNGGVTISGGEPLMQPEFVTEVFQRCKQENIHTCLETTLHISPEEIKNVAPYTDMFIVDIKHLSTYAHMDFVGTGNDLILENINLLDSFDKPIIVRIPIMPGFNDSLKDISDIGDYIVKHLKNVPQVQLLQFRSFGHDKYEALGIDYRMNISENSDELKDDIAEFVNILKSKGIKAFAGTNTPISL